MPAALGCREPEAKRAVAELNALGAGPVEVYEDGGEELVEAVRRWAAGSVDLLWKLELPTATVMREVLRAARESWFSHLGLVICEDGRPSFLVADAGLNRRPGLDELVAIAERSVSAARRLGVDEPLVGLVAHREQADASVPGSVLLSELRDQRGAEIEAMGARLVGPTALDVALDPDAAAAKGELGTRPCDVLLVPDIIVGNVLYKAFMLRRDCLVAGAAYDGAGRAVAVPSRAATVRERIAAAALATALGGERPPAGQTPTQRSR
jgi:phosphotransacetylase